MLEWIAFSFQQTMQHRIFQSFFSFILRGSLDFKTTLHCLTSLLVAFDGSRHDSRGPVYVSVTVLGTKSNHASKKNIKNIEVDHEPSWHHQNTLKLSLLGLVDRLRPPVCPNLGAFGVIRRTSQQVLGASSGSCEAF